MFGGGTCGGGTTTVGRSQHGVGGGGGGGLQPEWQGGRVGHGPLQLADASVGNKNRPRAATPNAIAARMYRAGTVICRFS
jgi:ribosomal protein L4